MPLNRPLIDMTGRRFNRWTCLNYHGQGFWNCRCDCGTVKPVKGAMIRNGSSKGCIKCNPGLGHATTHGATGSRLYTIYRNMRRRCEDPNNREYHNYGGRGIIVCNEWTRSFEAFQSWAFANGYEKHLTIDRADNSQGYEPSNCRWATPLEQSRNVRRNVYVTYQGRRVLLCVLAEERKMSPSVLRSRILNLGWPIERALTTPVRRVVAPVNINQFETRKETSHGSCQD